MAHELLETSSDGGHYHVQLADPEGLNPIGDQLQSELHDVIDDVERDDTATVLTLTGNERAFAVGADISQVNAWLQDDDWRSFVEFSRRGQLLVSRLADLDIVTVAGINGYALGGGLELALACDLRLMEESAEVGFPEVDLGLIPGWGGTQRLPEMIGEQATKELIITGQYIGAERANELGLVNHVVEDGSVEAELFDLAGDIAEKPSHIVPRLLDAIEQAGEGESSEKGLSYELMYTMLASSEEETIELVRQAAE